MFKIKRVLPAHVIIKCDEIEFKEKTEETKLKTETGFEFYVPKKESEKIKRAQLVEESAIMLGTIIAVGDDCWDYCKDQKPFAKIGDRVMYRRYTGEQFMYPDESGKECRHRHIADTEILLVIE